MSVFMSVRHELSLHLVDRTDTLHRVHPKTRFTRGVVSHNAFLTSMGFGCIYMLSTVIDHTAQGNTDRGLLKVVQNVG